MQEQTAQIKESELLSLIDKTRALDATYKLLDIVLQSFDFDELTNDTSESKRIKSAGQYDGTPDMKNPTNAFQAWNKRQE